MNFTQSTTWEHIQVSEATAKYLRLGEYQVWSHMAEGVPVFLVLRAYQAPGQGDGGYTSIESALRTKGLRT
jgi:hypothetical protein